MEYKLAYVVIVCCLLVHMTWIGMDMVFFHIASIDGALTYFLSQAVAYFLYPLLGWLADVYFTRYKFILFSFITMIVATVVMVTGVTLFMIYTYARPLFVIAGIVIISGLLGLGLFEYTAIQFGMLESSSNELGAFIQWYYWSSNIGPLVIMYVATGVLEYLSQCMIELTMRYPPQEMYSDLYPYFFVIVCTAVLIMAGLQLVCAYTSTLIELMNILSNSSTRY